MTTDTLTSIDALEQEMTALQAQLHDGIAALALLEDIPGQFAGLAQQSAAMSAATQAAEAQGEQLAAARAAFDERFARWLEEAGERDSQLRNEWESFRAAAEAEQNQVLRLAMTTRQELTDRAAAQEQLVAALDAKLSVMNDSLTNIVSDLQAARRSQQRLAWLLTVVALAALALSAAAAWTVFL